MKLTKLNQRILMIQNIFVVMIIAAKVLNRDSLVSVLFYATFFLTGYLWIGTISNKIDVLLIVIIIISVFSLCVNSILSGSSISFQYYKKYIMFLSTLMYFASIIKIEINDKMRRFIIICNSILALFFTAIYFIKIQEVYILNGRISDYLLFNFDNPNVTGMFLACIAVMEENVFFYIEKTREKIFHLILLIIMIYFINETRCRAALIVLLLSFICCLYCKLFKKKQRIPKQLVFLFSVFPIIFALVYLLIVNSDYINNMFGFLVSEGKGLDSRVKVWTTAFQYFGQHPVFGTYSDVMADIYQMHNTHIDILSSYGIIVFVLFCALIYNVIVYCSNRINNKVNLIFLMGFCSVLQMGIAESALYSGGMGIYILVGNFILMANRDGEVVEKKQDE